MHHQQSERRGYSKHEVEGLVILNQDVHNVEDTFIRFALLASDIALLSNLGINLKIKCVM